VKQALGVEMCAWVIRRLQPPGLWRRILPDYSLRGDACFGSDSIFGIRVIVVHSFMIHFAPCLLFSVVFQGRALLFGFVFSAKVIKMA